MNTLNAEKGSSESSGPPNVNKEVCGRIDDLKDPQRRTDLGLFTLGQGLDDDVADPGGELKERQHEESGFRYSE